MPVYPMVDSRIVAQTFALRRVVSEAKLVDPSPMLSPALAYGSCLRDPKTGQWTMWYLGYPIYCEYYATSDDGLHWQLPELDMVTHADVKPKLSGPNAFMGPYCNDAAGNRLIGSKGPEGFSVIDNEITPHPHARGRYTALYLECTMPGQRPSNGLSLAWSDDGLHWHAYENNPFIHGWPDTGNNFFYDSRIGRYVLYGRPIGFVEHTTHANRLVGRCTSEDLIHWTPYETVLDTDERDGPAYDLIDEAALRGASDIDTARQRAAVWAQVTEGAVTGETKPMVRGRSRQWYGLTVWPYHDCYLGLGMMYDVPSGEMWPELLHSYDGIDWRREALREPFFQHDPMSYACMPPVLHEDKHWLYYGHYDRSHHGEGGVDPTTGRSAESISLRQIPRDRWVGYHAARAEGELLTQPIDRPVSVTLNAAVAAGGHLRVALTDSNGVALEGYDFDDMDPIEGEGFDLSVTWGSRCEIPLNLPGTVRLRIVMREAALYAITLE